MTQAVPCFIGTKKVNKVVRDIEKTSVQAPHPETGVLFDKYIGKVRVGVRFVAVHSWGKNDQVPTIWFTE